MSFLEELTAVKNDVKNFPKHVKAEVLRDFAGVIEAIAPAAIALIANAIREHADKVEAGK